MHFWVCPKKSKFFKSNSYLCFSLVTNQFTEWTIHLQVFKVNKSNQTFSCFKYSVCSSVSRRCHQDVTLIDYCCNDATAGHVMDGSFGTRAAASTASLLKCELQLMLCWSSPTWSANLPSWKQIRTQANAKQMMGCNSSPRTASRCSVSVKV